MLTSLKSTFFRPRQPWEQNLFVLWFGTFMAGVAFSLIMPFMSLYIDTLGDFSKTELNFYSGITYSSTFLITAIVSPLWGRLADRKGRKLMILRASFGMAIVLGLMGLVSNVYQLIALRLLQGVFSGYISNAQALIATETPKRQSGKALGILVTGSVTGTLFGPLIGGAIAGIFGYRVTFFITAIILLIVFLLSYFFVHEHFTPVEKGEMHTSKEIFQTLHHPKLIIGMFVTTLIIQASNYSISPILSLYVRELLHNVGNITFISGCVASIPGIATLIAAPRLGILGDKIGTERILKIALIAAIFIFIPMSLVTNVWQLGGLRFLIGITDAAMLPAVQTILTKNTPAEFTGRVFSYNQSFQAMGSVVGPMIGSTVSGVFDYKGVFVSTAILVGINLVWVMYVTKGMYVKKAK